MTDMDKGMELHLKQIYKRMDDMDKKIDKLLSVYWKVAGVMFVLAYVADKAIGLVVN